MNSTNSNYRWMILALVVLTSTFVVAAPIMSLPVLFREIANDLDMNLVQVGFVVTIISLTGLFMSLIGGALGDRFGPRLMLIAACLLTGITGALRGFADSYPTFLFTTLLVGLVMPMININLSKMCAVWFTARERGTANGAVSVGMALGFLLGSLLSATVLSPLLGGWRGVFFVFGGVAAVVSLLWFITQNQPGGAGHVRRLSLRADLAHVVRVRNMWVMGLAGLGYGGCVNATLAYLPLYLRGIGWSGANADSTVAAFHAISLVGAIPLAVWSDKAGKRRVFLLASALAMAAGVGALTSVNGALIVAAVLLAGFMRDGFMAIFMTTVMENKDIGVARTGSAIGFVAIFFQLGGVFAPPLGNSLASVSASLPFLFWAMLAALGFIAFLFLDTGALDTEAGRR